MNAPPPPPPPKTEVKQKIALYQKTVLPVKTPPPVPAPLPTFPMAAAPSEKPPVTEPTNYTHILTVYIQHNSGNTGTSVVEINRRILQTCARILHNTTTTKMLANNIYVPILWSQQGSIHSNKYYANVELFGDVAVKKHTVLLLQDVVQQIDDLFDYAFSKKEIELIFDVTKPLTRKVTLL